MSVFCSNIRKHQLDVGIEDADDFCEFADAYLAATMESLRLNPTAKEFVPPGQTRKSLPRYGQKHMKGEVGYQLSMQCISMQLLTFALPDGLCGASHCVIHCACLHIACN